MTDNPFGKRLRYIEAKEKMDAAENHFYDCMVVGHNFDMSREDVVEKLFGMTTRLLKQYMDLKK